MTNEDWITKSNRLWQWSQTNKDDQLQGLGTLDNPVPLAQGGPTRFEIVDAIVLGFIIAVLLVFVIRPLMGRKSGKPT